MTKMPTGREYALLFKDGSRKEFRAADTAQALSLAQAILPQGLAAALCEDGVPVAEIAYSAEGYWAVSKPSAGQGC